MKKRKILKIIFLIILALGILTGLTFLILDLIEPIKLAIENKSWQYLIDRFSEYGIYALVVIGLIQAFLITITFIPGAPLQIFAGVVLDPIHAFITIMLGILLGNILMYILVKKLGPKIDKYYLKKDKKQIEDLQEIKSENKLSKKVIFLYLLPVISYGIIAFTCAKSKMKFFKYILITTLGTIPSVMISVSLGTLAIDSYVFLFLLIALIILSGITIKYSDKLQKLFSKKPKKDMQFFQQNVRKANSFLYWFFKLLLKRRFFRKVNLQVKNQEFLKDVKGPYMLLYNHPSFYDWIYAFAPLYPTKINPIMAYYYFCNYRLGRLLHKIGGFPKFLYQPDLSAIKNIKKVIKSGGILGIAPEGRLSAYGTLETIAPATEKLLKHLQVPVYLGHINGSYLTKPKWAKQIRKGRIDLEYKLILSKEDLEAKTLTEIKDILYEEIDYDDFAWQEQNRIYFKGNKLAEGVENILYLCPKCLSEFSIIAKGKHLHCSNCHTEIILNNYYDFISNEVLIPKNIRDWYLIQKAYEAKNIEIENYELIENVTLKLPHNKGKGFMIVGMGIAKYTSEGISYTGTLNGENVQKIFRIQNIPAIPFGANQNFEVYHDNTLYYFVPENPRHSVKWSVVGEAMYNKYQKENSNNE